MTQGLRDFGNALVIAMLSIGLMVGALSISLVEFVPEAAPTATNIVMPSPLPLTATPTFPPTLTPIPGLETPTLTVLSTPTNVLFQSTCLPPLGWSQIILQSNDTLDSLAIRYRVNRDDLKRGNCLVSDNLVAGKVLYVPPVPTSTFQSCVQGAAGWIKSYTVRPGDTFYSIATNHYSTAGLLKNVNCRTSDIVYIGEVLWVPKVSTRTPFPTPLPGITVTPYPTDPLTETALPFTITVQPSNTPVPPSATIAPTFTSMPTPTASQTAFP